MKFFSYFFGKLPRSFWITWSFALLLVAGFVGKQCLGDSLVVLGVIDNEILKRQQVDIRDRESGLILKELILWRDREWQYFITPIYTAIFVGVFIYPFGYILYYLVFCIIRGRLLKS